MPAKHTAVTYEGPSGSFTIDGVVLQRGVATEVEDAELLNELKKGSWRTKGHSFVTGPASDATGDDMTGDAVGEN